MISNILENLDFEQLKICGDIYAGAYCASQSDEHLCASVGCPDIDSMTAGDLRELLSKHLHLVQAIGETEGWFEIEPQVNQSFDGYEPFDGDLPF